MTGGGSGGYVPSLKDPMSDSRSRSGLSSLKYTTRSSLNGRIGSKGSPSASEPSSASVPLSTYDDLAGSADSLNADRAGFTNTVFGEPKMLCL